jgi:16S rRNA (cytosine1402-N4)-methyltransferase
MTSIHIPVLLQEVIHALAIQPSGRYIDATLGLGGYSREIVRLGGEVLSIDADADAVERVKKGRVEMDEGKERWHIVHGNFRDIETLAHNHGWNEVDGVVFDLGVSSVQLDTPQKGFSYRFEDAPLDMRFDASVGTPAATVIKEADESTLYEIFTNLGEEKHARTIAHAVVRARRVKPLTTGGQLSAVVADALGTKNVPHDTLARIFQALRMYVNDEKGALRDGLAGAKAVLKPGGTLAVVSFHSLEDRIVKLFIAQEIHVVTKKPITATDKEQFENRRSRSAKLRIGIK